MFRPRKRKPSEKKQRSPEFYARQATRTVRSRTFWLMLVMGILLFVILFFQLYHLQITRHQEMQTRALDQQTRQTVVSAFRGTIYDRNGSQLAVSVSTETVFLSPKDLKEQLDAEEERLAGIRQKNASLAEGETPLSEESQVHWTYDSLAASLSGILGVSQDTIRSCMDRTDSQYEVLAKKVDEDVADQIPPVHQRHRCPRRLHGGRRQAGVPLRFPGLSCSGLCGHRQHRPVRPGIPL